MIPHIRHKQLTAGITVIIEVVIIKELMFVLRSLSQKTAPFALNGLKTMLRRTTPCLSMLVYFYA